MEKKELIEQVLTKVRGNDEAIQKISTALMSHDETKVKQVFHDVAGVDLTDSDLQTILYEYGDEVGIAAIS